MTGVEVMPICGLIWPHPWSSEGDSPDLSSDLCQLWGMALGGCGACQHMVGTYIPDGKKMVRGFKY